MVNAIWLRSSAAAAGEKPHPPVMLSFRGFDAGIDERLPAKHKTKVAMHECRLGRGCDDATWIASAGAGEDMRNEQFRVEVKFATPEFAVVEVRGDVCVCVCV